MKISTIFKSAAIAALISVTGVASAQAQDMKAKTVVLVHGAFADGSSWSKVIPLLTKAGLKVVAVQNPLDSLKNDVAFTNRAIDNAEGPVVLVGHSWGGVVITEAGQNSKVKALVYVSAYAPDVGQSLVTESAQYPATEGRTSIVKDAAGFLRVTDEGVRKYFAADLPRAEQDLVAATQGTFSVEAAATPVTKAAWHTVPSFAVVSTDDTIIPPALQRDQVKRMKATAVEVASSHVSLLSHPEQVAQLIIKAAQ